MQIGTPTLDQLAVLVAIADHGSMAAAGRALGRATSVIAYQLGALEAQLGLALFIRGTTRRPRLTDAGRLVLAYARETLGNVSALRAGVAALSAGQEAELSVSVTVMFPTATLVAALTALQARFPTLAVRLAVEALGAVQARLFDGTATLAIGGALDGVNERLVQRALAGVPLVPVAAPDHPLARPNVLPGEAQRHLAAGGHERETRAAQGWRWLGQHAGDDGGRRSGDRTVGAAGPARLAGHDLPHRPAPPARVPARHGRALADGLAGRCWRRFTGRNNRLIVLPGQAAGAQL
jgi:DNA-binding transcriptional LysR family regulator